MLAVVGQSSLAELVDAGGPGRDPAHGALALPAAVSEAEALAELRALAGRNRVLASDDRDGLPRHPHPERHPARR